MIYLILRLLQGICLIAKDKINDDEKEGIDERNNNV